MKDFLHIPASLQHVTLRSTPAPGPRQQQGGWSSGGAVSTQSSSRDLNAHTKLKLRKGSQVVDRRAALQESLLKMEEAEKKAQANAKRAVKIGRDKLLLENGKEDEEKGRLKLLKQTADVDEEKIRASESHHDAVILCKRPIPKIAHFDPVRKHISSAF